MTTGEEFTAEFNYSYEESLPEELLEEYYIIERLGTAGDCDTLLVKRKRDHARMVAKCYFGSESSLKNSEAMLLSKIQTDSIPDYVQEYHNETCQCILRKYVEGMTLAEYVRTHFLTTEAITEIAMELVHIMKMIHESEPVIIHRDIKPENIIIREDKSLVLIDFGISRIYKKGNTSDTIFCGTRNYAPPEQYGFMQTDIRSDIYSFGVVLSWMLTGKEKPVRNPQTRLEIIAAKCCAYDPKNRYKNDTVLLKALQKTTGEYTTKRRRTRKICLAFALLCVVILVSLGVYQNIQSGKGAYTFQESVIEEAVRLSLGKPQGFITKEDLLDVKEIYIFADEVYENMDEYYKGQEKWYALDERIHGKTENLTDIKYMKNLQILYIGGTKIEDLSPLRKLEKLENVSLQDNAIHDLSALSGKSVLQELYLVGNTLDDIEPVRTWPAIQYLNLAETGDYDGSPLETLKGMKTLDVFHGPDASKYLDGLYVEVLRVGWAGQTDLEFIKKVSHVEKLWIDWSTIRDISALKGREDIIYLNMESCAIDDLSPLFTMPNLIKIEMSARQKKEMEELVKKYGEPSFEIVYTR